MEDFYRLYQDLPIPDLVKVARTPSDYLPEAVTAAEKILRERGVTREQIAVEEWNIAQKEISDGLQRGRRREYTAWIGELFGGDRMTPRTDRWLTALLLAYGCYYTYTLFLIMRQVAWFLGAASRYRVPESFLIWKLVLAVYITVCLYCLMKQMWLGWSLLFVYLVTYTAIQVAFLFRVYAHHYFFLPVHYSHIIELMLYAGSGVILLRPYVISTFGVNDRIKSRTLLVAVLIGIARMLL